MWLVGHRVAKAERVGWVCFSEFFLDDKTAAAAVFSSCSFVPLTLFWVKFSDGQLLWLRDLTSKIAGGQVIFEIHVFRTSFDNKSKDCG